MEKWQQHFAAAIWKAGLDYGQARPHDNGAKMDNPFLRGDMLEASYALAEKTEKEIRDDERRKVSDEVYALAQKAKENGDLEGESWARLIANRIAPVVDKN